MEEYLARSASGQSSRRPLVTLGRLLLKNRSHRGYDPRFIVREDQLRRIIGVNTRIPSARNRQVLRFRPVLADEAPGVLAEIRLGGALPELHLPLPGTECFYHRLLDGSGGSLRRYRFGYFGPEHAAPGG